MSQENVELVKRSFELFLRGDLEAWIETLHPDVGWDISRASTAGRSEPRSRTRGAVHGHDGDLPERLDRLLGGTEGAR